MQFRLSVEAAYKRLLSISGIALRTPSVAPRLSGPTHIPVEGNDPPPLELRKINMETDTAGVENGLSRSTRK
jgi:hypothetical protein